MKKVDGSVRISFVNEDFWKKKKKKATPFLLYA